MYQVTVDEACATLPQLVEAARDGEEVIITEDGVAVAKLVAVTEQAEYLPRKAGSALDKGYVFCMADDFDAPLSLSEESTESITQLPPRQSSRARGLIHMRDDFDEPREDFAEYQ